MVKITFFTDFYPQKGIFLKIAKMVDFQEIVAPEVEALETFYRHAKCSKCFAESKKKFVNAENGFKHVFLNFEFWSKKFFFDFSAEISAWRSKFLHFGGKNPFSALVLKILKTFAKFRIFSIP